MLTLPDVMIRPIVEAALLEDLGRGGDLTASLLPHDAVLSAAFAARKPGRVAGLACVRLAVHALDAQAAFEAVVEDGARVEAGAVLAKTRLGLYYEGRDLGFEEWRIGRC